MEFTDDITFQIHQCDTIFSQIDQNGDCQLNIHEFEAYVSKRNSA